MESGNDSMVMVHKFFEKQVYSYINYEIMDSKLGSTVIQKDNARKRFRAERNNAKIRAMEISPEKMIMTLRGQHRWLK